MRLAAADRPVPTTQPIGKDAGQRGRVGPAAALALRLPASTPRVH